MTKDCRIKGCFRKHKGRGLCNIHYMRLWRYGRVTKRKKEHRINLDHEERFFSYVDKTSSCWLWQGAPLKTGYGSFLFKGKIFRAHILSWILHNKRDVPEGMFVCHSCDVRLCVNPNHLFLGSNRDNIRDSCIKGRWHTAKLTPDEVLQVRKQKSLGPRILAERYGVTEDAIRNIFSGRSWSYIR